MSNGEGQPGNSNALRNVMTALFVVASVALVVVGLAYRNSLAATSVSQTREAALEERIAELEVELQLHGTVKVRLFKKTPNTPDISNYVQMRRGQNFMFLNYVDKPVRVFPDKKECIDVALTQDPATEKWYFEIPAANGNSPGKESFKAKTSGNGGCPDRTRINFVTDEVTEAATPGHGGANVIIDEGP